ncbi:MAG: DUF3137 domain-containing protein [Leptospiraceae bacterium]|nr:DUF3137 domain-containing protein [Leptospiraceae bacterium]
MNEQSAVEQAREFQYKIEIDSRPEYRSHRRFRWGLRAAFIGALLVLCGIGLMHIQWLDYGNSPYQSVRTCVQTAQRLLRYIFFTLTAITLILRQITIKKYIRNLVGFIFPEQVVYDHSSGLTREDYLESGFARTRIDSHIGKDLIKGILNNTEFQCSFINTGFTYRMSRSALASHRRIDFRGFMIRINRSTPFKGQTVVLPDKLERYLGQFARTIQNTDRRFGELVQLEDVEFENQFKVYATDQHVGRLIMTPRRMEVFNMMLQAIRSKGIQASFRDQNAFILIRLKRSPLWPSFWRAPLSVRNPYRQVAFLCLLRLCVQSL